jgi:hypothetical protein
MEQCWQADPQARPSGFDEISRKLEKVLEVMSGEASHASQKVEAHEVFTENPMSENPMSRLSDLAADTNSDDQQPGALLRDSFEHRQNPMSGEVAEAAGGPSEKEKQKANANMKTHAHAIRHTKKAVARTASQDDLPWKKKQTKKKQQANEKPEEEVPVAEDSRLNSAGVWVGQSTGRTNPIATTKLVLVNDADAGQQMQI